jgi:hypothetical protein
MSLQADADIARGQIVQVVKLLARTAEEQRKRDRGGDRVELGARLHAGHEQHVDTGGLVGFQPGDGVGDAGQRKRGGATDDHEARILATGQRGAHLAGRLIDRNQPGLGRAIGRG